MFIMQENDFVFFQSWKLPLELLIYLDLIVCYWKWTWNFGSLSDIDTSIPIRPWKPISKCNSDLDMYLYLSTSDWLVCKLKQPPPSLINTIYMRCKSTAIWFICIQAPHPLYSHPYHVCMNVCVHLFPHVPHIYLYAITFSLMKIENDFVFVVGKSIMKIVTT